MKRPMPDVLDGLLQGVEVVVTAGRSVPAHAPGRDRVWFYPRPYRGFLSDLEAFGRDRRHIAVDIDAGFKGRDDHGRTSSRELHSSRK